MKVLKTTKVSMSQEEIKMNNPKLQSKPKTFAVQTNLEASKLSMDELKQVNGGNMDLVSLNLQRGRYSILRDIILRNTEIF